MDTAPPLSPAGRTPTLGFTTVVATWLVIYVLLAPMFAVPASAIGGVMVGLLLVAGVVMGWRLRLGLAAGALVGGVVALTNLIILASLLGDDRPDSIHLSDAGWIAGLTAAAVACVGFGALVGRTTGTLIRGDRPAPSIDWTGRLALVAVATTLLMLVAGGIVTGLEAGLAIEGWLTADQYPLLLFPLQHMQQDGGKYVEHTHRLWGLLVGLIMIVLSLHLWRHDSRRWVVRFAGIVLLAVVVQGAMGGFRVTAMSTLLAIFHGVFGQVVFAAMVALAVFTAVSYRRGPEPVEHDGAAKDQTFATVLVLALLVQLGLGATYRHFSADKSAPTAIAHGALGLHLLFSIAVAGKAVMVGGRVASRYAEAPVLRRLGKGVLAIVCIQFALGVAALLAVMLGADAEVTPGWEIAVTTLHQTGGAVLLGTATALMVWMRRLVRAPSMQLAPAGA